MLAHTGKKHESVDMEIRSGAYRAKGTPCPQWRLDTRVGWCGLGCLCSLVLLSWSSPFGVQRLIPLRVFDYY